MSLFKHYLYNLFGVEKDIYGSANFLKGLEKYRLLNSRNNGLVIDGKKRITEKRSFTHSCIVAPTGTGKTTSYIIPNVLNLETSAVVTDPKGEIHKYTSGYLERKGFNVKVFNVSDLNNSLRFNPFKRANTHTEIKKVIDVLVSTAYKDTDGSQTFWNDSSKGIMSVLTKCLKRDELKYQNPANLLYLFNSFGVKGELLNDFIARNTIGDKKTFSEFNGFISNDEKVLLGALATAKTALDKFSDPEIAYLTADDNISFEELRKGEKPTIIYLICPEHEVNYYGFLFSLLYTQLFNYCMETDGKPIYFLLDEFGNMGKIPNMSSLIATLRSRNISVSLILQNTEQIYNTYGKSDGETILSNCVSKIFYPGLSLKTCDELQRILGNQTIRHTIDSAHRIGQDSDSVSHQISPKALMTIDEIRTMRDNQAIFIHGNKKPVLLKTTPFYKNRKLLRKSKIKPTKSQTENNLDIDIKYIDL